MLKAGIVGLPNVGKSTLFNALTKSYQAESANYPFCTIEPNKGIVKVPDERLLKLAEIAQSQKLVPAVFEFVDIAGLVKGASDGQGLGNQFLAHIREVDAIVQVVRCFEDENIIHVEGTISPIRDVEIITMELALADAESIDKRLQKLKKSKDKKEQESAVLLEKIQPYVAEGKRPPMTIFEKDELEALEQLQLISTKPMLIAANVSESALANPDDDKHFSEMKAFAQANNMSIIPISVQIEAEMSQLEAAEAQEFLETLGVESSGVDDLIKASYDLLGLATFFTVGPQEAHAWPYQKGLNAQRCAGEIHSDMERGFIRAEVIGYADYVACGGEKEAREKGVLRQEGRDYLMQDGDSVHFLFNV